MKNLLSSFTIINLKKNKEKDLKENNSINTKIFVHHRRDLDALG